MSNNYLVINNTSCTTDEHTDSF